MHGFPWALGSFQSIELWDKLCVDFTKDKFQENLSKSFKFHGLLKFGNDSEVLINLSVVALFILQWIIYCNLIWDSGLRPNCWNNLKKGDFVDLFLYFSRALKLVQFIIYFIKFISIDQWIYFIATMLPWINIVLNKLLCSCNLHYLRGNGNTISGLPYRQIKFKILVEFPLLNKAV